MIENAIKVAIKLHNSRRHCSHQSLCKWPFQSCTVLGVHCCMNTLWEQYGAMRTLVFSPLPAMPMLLSVPELNPFLETGTWTRPFRCYHSSQTVSIYFPATGKGVQTRNRYGCPKTGKILYIEQNKQEQKRNICIYFSEVMKFVLV